ncbi:uncharacterized protein GGS22DRAFT_29672 [Annulohypoxylon maeteangense]|uniref:uncharacterized protein n=1 Tax=Annulohypoxylon maeteangense TaxID=1927788 RepID=UPI002007A4E5|nr:uncharacterized protein GGS22DRAFT_29672 [Annulohypoxylon maeteangense]KAI0883378.1 hypothetical protein GGS22DRAFT_29672 [Annulohypoxylon maeteangense]
MDTTFSDDEKRFVLGEMIKVSTIDVYTLVEFIKAHHVEPNWMSMQLPGGRNMNQCFGAVETMFQTKYPPPNLTSFKRKSLSDLVDHPAKRQAMMAPLEPPVTAARVIQPRPPPNGYPPAVPVSISPPVTSTGKKRGRPSKADKEAQARAVYSRISEYTPITPAPLAPLAAQPQREYASSPGYEISSNPGDQKSKKRGFGAIDSPRQASSSFPLTSPASNTETPRAFPEPLEQVERSTLSPRDRGSIALDSRSPPLLPHIQQQQPDPSQGLPHLQPRAQPPHPYPPSPRNLQTYEPPHRAVDPIFPNRDRTRHDISKDVPPPVTTVADRS